MWIISYPLEDQTLALMAIDHIQLSLIHSYKYNMLSLLHEHEYDIIRVMRFAHTGITSSSRPVRTYIGS